MDLISGSYALTGVTPVQPNKLQTLLTQSPVIYNTNGSLYAVKVYRCATCGQVELVDEV